MTLTAQQIEARKSRIGASDVASIFGLPTFKGRNAHSLWLEKTDQLEPEDQDDTPDYIEAGNLLEPVILDLAERKHGALDRGVEVADPEGSPIVSILDGRVKASGRPVEAKTSGIFGPIRGTWGDPGTDEVPDSYIVQCSTQLLCTGADCCHLEALLGTRGFVSYDIAPQDTLLKLVRDVASDFWERYVEARRDPRTDWWDRLIKVHGVDTGSDPCEPVLETVRRLRKTEGKMIDIADPEPFDEWEGLRQVRLDSEKEEKSALAACLAALGDAEAATLPDGRIFTYYEQKRKGYEVKPSAFRVARLKKGGK
jgi:putative phage-type endonuclease